MEHTQPSHDLRKTPRYPMDVRVRVCFSRDGFLQRATVKATDISTTGIAMISPLPLPSGSMVEVEITLPQSRTPLRVKALIRNKNGVRYGVEFVSTTDFQKEEITRFCSGRKPASGVGPGIDSLPAVN